ncbi:hypothetical protein K7711_04955 [Nocardia sp. CA2R105]|uniref:hypothetical protein n=1 Tax=Nocardia coffeae TaxID=2873381 RepID=UPI001CA6B991|nr:hypothetical protein [Nocardia coffeae]MBY8855819.1 hypothetical protein [Nocardia coffeae]
MDNIHHTEAGGFQAMWRLDRHIVGIMRISNTSDDSVVASFDPDPFPDLAQVREQYPALEQLWNAIRHAFWSELLPPQHYSSRNP